VTTSRRTIAIRLLAVAVALIVFGLGLYVALDRSDSGTTPSVAAIRGSSSGTDSSVVATANGDKLHVYAAEGDAQPSRSLAAPRPFVPVVTLVLDRDGDWLHVLLPVRPNGSTGWVRSDDVTQSIVTYRVTVNLSDHRMVVRDGDSLVLETDVAVGKAETPTPAGLFFITELLSVPDPTGPYGPFAYGLSGHSPVLTDFANGDGQLGLHGTNQPELLGSDATHGCIRLSNDDIGKLAFELPLGTPVNVVA
jgi:lipoprotein-anchoring transpeptidase ErfK/SrfK